MKREDLYALVWSMPMIHAAKKFGISDVALAKTCRNANIPIPPRGYWAKKAAGKRTIQDPLPARGFGAANDVRVGRGNYYSNANFTDKEISGPPEPPPEFSETLDAVRERARQMVGKVTVPIKYTKEHHAIAQLRTEDKLRKEKNSTRSFIFRHEVSWFDEVDGRRKLRILNAIFFAVSRAGARATIRSPLDPIIEIMVGSQHVVLKFNVVTVPAKKTSKNIFEYDKPITADEHNQKRLCLGIVADGQLDIYSYLWTDIEENQLEDYASEISAEIITAGEAQYRARELHEHTWKLRRIGELREMRRQAEVQRAKEEHERVVRLEKEKIDRLLSDASLLRNAQDIRYYVSSVIEIVGTIEGHDIEMVEKWAEWAMQQADRIDPVKSGRFLEGFLTDGTREEH